jgi:excinuclease ABC subunit C
VRGINDFASMEEVVYRRYKRMLEEDHPLPQLVVIDGGKGQLNAAIKSVERLQLRGKIAMIGIAKRLEEIYFPDDPVPLYIDKNSESLKLIQHLRNEAHRFGITFHRLKRSGEFTRSTLEAIDGVGSRSVEKLFKRFKSIDKIKDTPIEVIAEEVGEARARLILNHLKGEQN